MRIDSPVRFVSAVIWPLALVAGYATAAIVNLTLFSYCGREACLTGSVWSTLPAWLAVAVGGWFLRHRGSRTKAALAGAVVALALGTSNAPLQLQHPLSFSINRFPGDFLIGLVFAPLNAMLMLAIAPGNFLFLSPLVGAGALFTFLIRTAVPQSWPAQRVRIAAAGLLIGAALMAEMGATPTVWSLSVHRRIAGFDLQAPPGTMPKTYRLWANKELSFGLASDSTADTALAFYDQVFEAWRRLDRTADDGIWVDPTGTVMAWAYCLNGNASVSVRDFDRAAWQHRLRRTSSGDRVLDFAKDGR